MNSGIETANICRVLLSEYGIILENHVNPEYLPNTDPKRALGQSITRWIGVEVFRSIAAEVREKGQIEQWVKWTQDPAIDLGDSECWCLMVFVARGMQIEYRCKDITSANFNPIRQNKEDIAPRSAIEVMIDEKQVQQALEAIGCFRKGEITRVERWINDCMVFSPSELCAAKVAELFDTGAIPRQLIKQFDCWHFWIERGSTTHRFSSRSIGNVEVTNYLPPKFMIPLQSPPNSNLITVPKPKFLSANSAYIDKHSKLFQERTGNKYVLDKDLRIVGLMPWFTWQELNKGMDSLGQSIDFLDEGVREPRKRAIARLLETGECQTDYYDFYDQHYRATFYLKQTIELTGVNDEILTTITNNDLEPKSDWQSGLWRSVAEAEKFAR